MRKGTIAGKETLPNATIPSQDGLALRKDGQGFGTVKGRKLNREKREREPLHNLKIRDG